MDDIADAGGSLYCFHLEATSESRHPPAPRPHLTPARFALPLSSASRCNVPDDPLPLIDHIHERKMKAGVAISPDTPSSAVTDAIADAADMLLVMTVYPGRGGQKFLARCVPKVAELRARFPDKDIEVDGGVGPSTIDVCADAGESSCARVRAHT